MKRFSFFLVVSALLSFQPAPLPGQEKLVEHHALLVEVDAASGVVVLKKVGQGEAKKFSLARMDLPITSAAGEILKLADLQKGDRLLVKIAGEEEVAEIRVETNCHWGTIHQILPQEPSLIFRQGPLLRKIPIPEGTRILMNRMPGKLESFVLQNGVQLTYNSKNQLVEIRSGGVISANPYFRPLTGGSAVVLQHDPKTQTTRILPLAGKFQEQTFGWQPWGKIRLYHSSYFLREADPSSLKANSRVTSYYAEGDNQKLYLVDILVPTSIRVSLMQLDRENRRVTFEEEGQEYTFPIASDAKIYTAQGDTTLDKAPTRKLISCGYTPDFREVVFLFFWNE